MNKPFLTFYTPTYRRPKQLAACLESVRQQTIVDEVEQIVIPDHIGVGVAGMFARVRDYASAVHGEYVHLLADDDELMSPTVVADVKQFARSHDNPPVIIVTAIKGGQYWPSGDPWPPRQGAIDLGCVITRADVWHAHVADYHASYEGDYWHMLALYQAGYSVAVLKDLVFSRGAVSRGAPEVMA